jgi:hypothetical protein
MDGIFLRMALSRGLIRAKGGKLRSVERREERGKNQSRINPGKKEEREEKEELNCFEMTYRTFHFSKPLLL